MYRLDPKTLALKIQMAAWRAFDRYGKLLNSRDGRKHVQDQIVGEIQRDFVNDHTCVVVTDSSGGYNPTRAAFGRDEPWPAPLEIERHER
jgi:hypothetical protein